MTHQIQRRPDSGRIGAVVTLWELEGEACMGKRSESCGHDRVSASLPLLSALYPDMKAKHAECLLDDDQICATFQALFH